MRIDVRRVEAIDRPASHKLRFTVCLVDETRRELSR
jgi:hypothetical protein